MWFLAHSIPNSLCRALGNPANNLTGVEEVIMSQIERVNPVKDPLWRKVFRIYMMTCFPCALLITLPSVFIIPSLLRKGDYLTLSLFVAIWVAFAVPLISAGLSKLRHRKVLGHMVALLSCPHRFSPRAHQVVDTKRGQYFGVDTDRGTLLYIRRVNRDTTDVVALTMDDWVKCEQDGACLRIHTCRTDVSPLCVYDHPASVGLIAETLRAMRHRRYPEPAGESWSHYVRRQSRLIPYAHNVIAPQDI